MVNFKLIGFVGDYIDDKSNMSLYLPVIELDSDLYVPMREKWGNVEDLKRVDDNGKQFVNMFDEGPLLAVIDSGVFFLELLQPSGLREDAAPFARVEGVAIVDFLPPEFPTRA